MKHYSGYAKSTYHIVEKQVCHRGHSELTLTHKNWVKLNPFGQPINTSKDAVEGPTKRQVSNKVYTEKYSVGLLIGYNKTAEEAVRSF